MSKIRCLINDQPVEIDDISPTMTLLAFLRERMQLTGTKEGCNEGDCGACTVILIDDEVEPAKFVAVNACLVLMPMMHCRRIYTIEALDREGGRHLVQESILRRYASQCGYCTPGIAMSLFEATYRHDMREPWQFVEQMAGNLCRCTGYRPIMESVRELAGLCPDDGFSRALKSGAMTRETLDYTYKGERFFMPLTLGELYTFLASHPEAMIVNGASDVSVMTNKRRVNYSTMVSLMALTELEQVTETESGLLIGAAAPLSVLEEATQERYAPIGRLLRYFASHQIKHVATVGGSVCGASPIGDMAPVLVALGASVTIGSQKGERTLPLDAFFLGYRKTVMAPGEAVIRFTVPPIPKNARCASYKISKRQELDISSLSATLYVETDADNIVTVARFPYGGMAAKAAARAHKAEAYVTGKPWTKENAEAAAELIGEDFTPISDVRASAWYRSKAAANLLRGFYEETLHHYIPARAYRPSATVQIEVKP
ncbi:MAG: xanthine dehydrogenase small subunit [Bradymonadales bacterium]|jgi:xanthine dehydrogenase small subunit